MPYICTSLALQRASWGDMGSQGGCGVAVPSLAKGTQETPGAACAGRAAPDGFGTLEKPQLAGLVPGHLGYGELLSIPYWDRPAECSMRWSFDERWRVLM